KSCGEIGYHRTSKVKGNLPRADKMAEPVFDSSDAVSPEVKMISCPATVIQATPDNTRSSLYVAGTRITSPFSKVK
ncbi:MAG TPA: hypothetical protein V6C90_03605, partial [Coleofasciculaceae cyanobacterium]